MTETTARPRRSRADIAARTREAILNAACVVIAETGLENIRMRGRAMESEISPAYLADLAEAYGVYFSHYTSAPVLIVNTGRVDCTTDTASFEKLVAEILRPCDARARHIHLG